MTGTDFLLDSLLKLAGVDIDQTKAQMKGFAQKFVEQDTILRDMHAQQHVILAQQRAIMAHFGIAVEPAAIGENVNGETEHNGRRSGNGSSLRS